MSGPARFARRVEVRAWIVVGTMARPVRRDWEPAVVMLATEQGRVTADSVAANLLGGRRAVASRLIATCVRFGLLSREDDSFVPTEDGRRAAQTQEVLVPERGTWLIRAAQDPLLPNAILRVSAWDEWKPENRRVAQQASEPSPVPSWVLPVPAAASVGDDGRAVRVIDFGEKGYGQVVSADLDLELVLELGEPSHRLQLLDNRNDGRVVQDLTPPAISDDELIAALREAHQDQGWPSGRGAGRSDAVWDVDAESLRVAFGDLNDVERATLKRTVVWRDVALGAFDRFDTATMADVPLLPKALADAEEWARWRLVHSIDGYATKSRFDAWVGSARALFPGYEVSLPARDGLADHVLRDLGTRAAAASDAAERDTGTNDSPPRRSPRWWQLVAPLDWRL